MTSESQKTLELVYGQKLAELLGETWNVSASPNETEWPDLLVNSQSHSFGIEVREIFLDESDKGARKRASETSHAKTLHAIAKSYYQDSEISIKVNILGCIKDREKILNTLQQHTKEIKDFEQIRVEAYSGCVLYIRVLPAQLGQYTRWNYVTDQVGWASKLEPELLEEKIIEKSDKLYKYRKHIEDVRLLLVCNPILNSGKMEYIKSKTIKSHGFNEVYFLSYPETAYKLCS